jgi:hypothetical protein
MNEFSKHFCDHTHLDSFHDCKVIGIAVDSTAAKAEFTIHCDLCGSTSVITLEGLYRLSVDDFWEGNIVFAFREYALQDVSPVALAKVLHIEYTADFLQQHDSWILEMRRDNLVMLILDSSYGCVSMGLCKSIGIHASENSEAGGE